jgi:ribosomal protein L40E
MVPADKLAAQARRSAGQAPGSAGPTHDGDLIAQRDRLAERFTMMQADLGGVFYEMVIRDHVRMDVLTRKAAELQRIDADLAQVERALRPEAAPPIPAISACRACGALHPADARFCANCGQTLTASGSGGSGPPGPVRGGSDGPVPPTVARTNGSSGTST